MPVFVPHKLLIEIMWYGGMEIDDINNCLYDNCFNPLPVSVYEEIIEMASTKAWISAHDINRETYLYNSGLNMPDNRKALYYDLSHFKNVYNAPVVIDVMAFMVGASRRTSIGKGSGKLIMLFNNTRLRQFVETSTLVGIQVEEMKNNLMSLDSNLGMWSAKTLLTYTKIFWNASRLAMLEKSIRHCDIREYFYLDRDNMFYAPYYKLMDASVEDVLAHFGVSEYGYTHRNNKILHNRISSQIRDWLDDKTRKLIPSDMMKLFMHIDAQLKEIEKQDDGADVYRREVERIFERVDYLQDNYKTMDEITKMYIQTSDDIETDEPFVKD